MTLNAARVAHTAGEIAWKRTEAPRATNTERYGLSEHLLRLTDRSMRLRFFRNETIFTEGDAAAHVYRVVSGCVRLCRHVSDGRRHISDFMFAGDVFGLGQSPTYPFTAESVTTASLTAYPRGQFENLDEGSSRVRTDMLAHLSARLQRTHQHLFVVSCQNARERLASFILRMLEQDQVVYGDRIDLAMGRQDIADHLGLTIETICRAIASLRTDGVIEVPNAHQFVVKSPSALRLLAEGQSAQ